MTENKTVDPQEGEGTLINDVNNAIFGEREHTQRDGRVIKTPYLQIDINGQPVIVEGELIPLRHGIVVFSQSPHANQFVAAAEMGDSKYGHFQRFDAATRDARVVDLVWQYINAIHNETFRVGKRIYINETNGVAR